MGRCKVNYRYSLAFQQKVVSDIESGRFSICEAQKVYGINGNGTLQKWLRKFGKDHLIERVVRIEMRGEKDRIKMLEDEKRRLESALAQSHMKVMALETLIEVAEEHYQSDFKKNFGSLPPKGCCNEQPNMELKRLPGSMDIVGKLITSGNE
jgi:transposase-like protein